SGPGWSRIDRGRPCERHSFTRVRGDGGCCARGCPMNLQSGGRGSEEERDMARRGASLILAAGAALVSAGCIVHTVPSRTVVVHTPATTQVVVKPCSYRYYPQARVYYTEDRKVWYWREGERWKWGPRLPGNLQVQLDTPVTIVLSTERPYE